jgi:Cd2+/Zn2+-exporting ATPase
MKSVPLGQRRSQEFAFREFFELGLEESASPFLTPFARKISRNLPLKASCTAAGVLFASFLCSIYGYTELSMILLSCVFLIVGVPAVINSIEDVAWRKDVNIDVLMTLAAFAAIFIGNGFEGALLLVLFALSGAIEDTVSLKAKSAIMTLHGLVPTKACVVEGAYTKERAVQDVTIGSLVLVRAGEIVPLDGIVVEGTSSISVAHITGESAPIRKGPAMEVPSGARVLESSLTIRVTHTSRDSTVSRIVELITHAHERKPKLERWFDKFARVYSISIIALSLGVALSFKPLLEIPFLGNEGSLYRAIAFLITASPCALILAVPIAYLSALGSCAKKGIILKGGVVLDALRQCSVVAFDKTGTLTLGVLSVDAILGQDHYTEKEVLSFAASLERNALHPIAKAIVKKAEEENIPLKKVDSVQVIAGFGVEGIIDDKRVFIGDVVRAQEMVGPTQMAFWLREETAKWQERGSVVAALVIEDRAYLLALSDKPRPGVAKMIASLRFLGLKVRMLTGDHYTSAELIARQVGIDTFEAELKPEDKLAQIEVIAKREGLAMCGDGVNDAPALARATVGIAMGQIGSATAKAYADVILLRDSIDLLDWLFEKAYETRKIVGQNVAIALTAIVLGSIPALFGSLPLWLAVIVHEGGTVLVGLNALRLVKS